MGVGFMCECVHYASKYGTTQGNQQRIKQKARWVTRSFILL